MFDTHLEVTNNADIYVGLAGISMSGAQGDLYVNDSMAVQTTYLNFSCQKRNDYEVYCPGAFFSMNKDETTVVRAEQNGIAL